MTMHEGAGATSTSWRTGRPDGEAIRAAARAIEEALVHERRAWPPPGRWQGGARDDLAERRDRWRAEGEALADALRASLRPPGPAS